MLNLSSDTTLERKKIQNSHREHTQTTTDTYVNWFFTLIHERDHA